MEDFVGSDVDVVLSIREGVDFGFINVPVIACATLNGNRLETDPCEVHLGSVIPFNIELVWQSNKANIKKMKNNMVAVRLEILKLSDGHRKEKVGYVIMNLKTAQCLPRGKEDSLKENYVKLLGLGKEGKGYSPQLLLSLRIQEKQAVVRPEEAEPVEAGHGEGAALPDSSEPSPRVLRPQAATPRSKLSITKTPSSVAERGGCSGDDQAPGTRMVEAFHAFSLEVHLKAVLWHKLPPRFHFRFHHSRSENMSTAHPEVVVSAVGEEVQLCGVMGQFRFTETPRDLEALLQGVPPVVSVCRVVHSRPMVIAKAVVDTAKLSPDGEGVTHTVSLLDVKSQDELGRLTYTAQLTDLGPHAMQELSLRIGPPLNMYENDLPPLADPSITDRIVDELEEWKERQKQKIQQEFNSKLQKEMVELRKEWMERRQELDTSVTERMEQCKELGESLLRAKEELQQRTKEVNSQKQELAAMQEHVGTEYNKLLTERAEETESMQKVFEERLTEKLEIIERLQREMKDMVEALEEVRLERDGLRQRVADFEAEQERNRNRSLSDEQTATLIQDLKTMQEKLETANNSKLFFKEQWGRAVREIHRIKAESSKEIQSQLQCRRDELKRLGLEQVFHLEKARGGLDRDDMLEARDFLDSDFEVRSSEADFHYRGKMNYEAYKTNMDIVKENNSYLLKFSKETEERLKRLIEERDRKLQEGGDSMYDETVARLNKEIRHILEH